MTKIIYQISSNNVHPKFKKIDNYGSSVLGLVSAYEKMQILQSRKMQECVTNKGHCQIV